VNKGGRLGQDISEERQDDVDRRGDEESMVLII
jgi:hypothetical protein